ncbi:acyl-CoA dehydrogenase family protein, partial [Pantoea rodasii]|uniref:acyl-CoA dehydrogenase family protein n=1 Tax=Pantoea rodasii TaxID=1076549 RepID=UPI001E2F120E
MMVNKLPFLSEILPVITESLAEHAEQVDRSGEFPQQAFARLHQQGLLHYALPITAGGSGG